MKPVFATGIFPPDIGGPATSVAALATAWAAQGHDVTVVTYADDAASADAHPFAVRRVRRAQPAWRKLPAYVKELWRASSAPGPIFAQDGVPSGLPALVVATLRRRALVVRVTGDLAWERAQAEGGYRESIEHFQRDRNVPLRIALLRAVQRFVYRRADRVVAPSRYLADLAVGWGVPAARVRTVHNGVHLPDVPADAPRSPRRIVAAGRLVPWKNFDVLIKAMAKVLQEFPDATLAIAGDGPEGGRLRALADAPMLKGRVEFVGALGRAELHRLIAGSAAFALPSSYEGFSHQLVEAMACGTPVVASRAGGNPEIVQDGVNGLLVEPGDAHGLAEALASLLRDPSRAQAFAAEGRKAVGDYSASEQVRLTGEAVLGDGKLKVLLISRDPSAADPASPSVERLRAYAARVDALEVVAIGRTAASPRADVRGYHARAVDSRRGPLSLLALCRETERAARDADASIIVAQDPFEAGVAARYAAFRLRLPYVVEDHGGFFAGGVWAAESAMNAARAWVGRHVVRASQGIRTVSARAAVPYASLAPGVPVEVVPVAMRLARGPITPKSSGPFTVLYAGRFSPEKNLTLLVRAFAALRRAVPEAVLLLSGDGPGRTRVEGEAAIEGVTAGVRFLPWTDDMASVYAQADVAALASDREGYGRFPAEAMSYGLPVVMTDVGLARELVRHGTEGFVVPTGDAAAFAQALITLAQQPPTRHLMAAAARRRSESLPDAASVADRVTRFWRAAAGRP